MWPFKSKPEYAKAGDTVKCIDDRDWNNAFTDVQLLHGNKYKVLNVVICPTCNDVAYDIGAKLQDKLGHTRCIAGKREHYLPAMGIHLAGAFRFEKSIKSAEEIKAEIQECLEVENYELAQILTEELKK